MKMKFYIGAVLIGLFFTGNRAFSQGNTCATATPLTVTTDSCVSAPYTNVGATTMPGDPVPACWSPSSISHNVWFSFQPPTTSVNISTNFGYALANTQIAVYSGSCGTLTQIACQEDINAATGLFHTSVIINGLNVSNTYYIMVDGNGNTKDEFGICIQTMNPPGPPSPIQDCPTGQFLCDKSPVSTADGAGNVGSIQESPSCFGSPGERSSTWYRFTVGTSGTLTFTIAPNSPGSAPKNTVDFDFAVYDITNGCLGTQLSCNWVPPASNCYTIACALTGVGCANGTQCNTTLNVVAGNTYAILVDRFTANNADGFDLTFGGTAVFASPNTNFIANTVCAGTATQFTDLTGGSNFYNWNFGDGGTSSLKNPTHTYAAPGNYSVTLITTSNPGGCQNAITKSITVTAGPTVSITPIAPSYCNPGSVALTGSVTLNPSGAYSQSFSNGTDYAIPDGGVANNWNGNPSGSTASSPITVTGISPTGWGLTSICLNISHGWDADVIVYLVNSCGNKIRLFRNLGGSGDNFTNTCFNTTSTNVIGVGAAINTTPPFSSTYAPEGGAAAFATWVNSCANPNGTWYLNVGDQASVFAGTLLDWTLTLSSVNAIASSVWTPPTNLTSTTTLNTTASPTATTTYTLTVTDAIGCIGSAPVTVTVNPAPPAPTANNASRCGPGTVNLSVNGCATGTLNWYTTPTLGASINTGATYTTPNLSSTTIYYVSCTENGCEGPRAPVTATINSFPTFTATATPVNCFGSCIGGAVNASNASGTVGPYSYFWNNGLGAGQSFSNVCPNSYDITVTDGNLCTATQTVVVTEPSAVAVSASAISTKCVGSCDGTITAGNASGGNAPFTYTYTWNTLGIGQGFSTACVGPHTVTAEDSKGCTASTTVNVTEPPILTINVVSTNDASCGIANGSFTVSGSGGTGALTYSMDDVTYQGSGTFTGVSATTHTVYVKDANGCKQPVSVTINDLSGLTASVSGQLDITCNGANDGTATYTASGSVGPYTYSIDGLNYASLNVFSGLTPGNHTLYAKDNNGCVVFETINIIEPTSVIATVSNIVPATCGFTNGSFDVSGSGGTPGYTYSNGGVFQPGTAFTGLGGGLYNVSVKDSKGCVGTTTANVSDLTGLIANIGSQTAVSCYGGSDGSVTISASGGGVPYLYSIDNEVTYVSGNVFGNLAVGPYTVYVKDNNNCTVTVGVNINEPIAVSFNITNVTDASCGLTNGAIAVTGTGGDGNYQYNIDGGAFQSSGSFTGLGNGNHTVLVKDGKNCSYFEDILVNDLSGLSISVTNKTDISCNGLTDGSITVQGNGTSGYTYSINGGVFGPSGTFPNLGVGTYTLTVKDVNACTSPIIVSIIQPSQISTSIVTQTSVSCAGGNDGSVEILANGGTPPYQYKIDVPVTSVFQSNPIYTGLSAGSYNITVRDANGCTKIQAVLITQPLPLSSMISSQTNISCYGYSNGSVTIAGMDGTAPYLYSLDGITYSSLATFSGLDVGPYTFYVKDDKGCTVPQNVNITQPGRVVINVTTTAPNFEICIGSQIPLKALGANTYSWSSEPGLSAYTGSDVNANPTTTTTYTVTGTNASGCFGDTTVTVIVNQLPVININASSTTICEGTCATLTASGAPTIQWTPSIGISPGTNFPTVTACPTNTTQYTVFGTSAQGCVGSSDVTINVTGIPTITITPNVASICSGDNVDLLASGASSYEWLVNSVIVGTGSVYNANPTTTTTYTVTGYISGGCTNNSTVQLTVNTNPTVNIVPNTPLICEGESVDLQTFCGFCDSFEWYLNGNLVSTSSTFSVNPTSNTTYTAIGTNSTTGCFGTGTATVFVSPLPTIIVNPETICKDDIVSLTANGADTYVWDNSSGTLSSNSGMSVVASPLTTTTYTVWGTQQVSSTKSCTNSTTVNVTVNPLPVVTVTPPSAIICKGNSVTLTPGGANTYSWSPMIGLTPGAGVSMNAAPTIIGNNTYTVTGINTVTGCVNDTTVTVKVNDLPVPSIVFSNNDICFGETITLVAFSSTDIKNCTWSVLPPYDGGLSATTGGSISAHPNDSLTTAYNVVYNLVLEDNNGCFGTIQSQVAVNPIPDVQVTASSDSICNGESVTLSAINADNYTWAPSSNLGSSVGATVVASPTVSGPYLYTVTGTTNAGTGCVNYASAGFFVRPPLTLTTLPDTICEGNSAFISVLALGAKTPYTYSWANSSGGVSGIGNSTSQNTSVTPASTEVYTITVNANCNIPAVTASLEVFVNPNPNATFATIPGCMPYSASIPNLSQTNNATSNWDFGNGATSQKWNGLNVYNNAGQYAITLTVTDTVTGCWDTEIKNIVVNGLPIADYYHDPLTAKVYNPMIIFDASISSVYQAPIVNYVWDYSTGDIDTLANNLPFSYAFPDTGHFPVTLTVIDANGCISDTTYTVIIEPDYALFIPNAFTPNGDGKNDEFAPKGYGLKSYELIIFDRWGNLVYSTGIVNNPDGETLKGWDGRSISSSDICQEDVYVYLIKGETIMTSKPYSKTGHVTLIK